MAFPYPFFEGFEDGTKGTFNSETDNDAKLDVMHYKDMVRLTSRDGTAEIPWHGAYAAHINLAGGTANAYYEETDGFDTAQNTVVWVRFYLYVTEDLTMADTDRFDIFALQSAGPVNEVTIGIRDSSGTKQLIVSETASSTAQAATLTLGMWHLVELRADIDSSANDGTIDLYLDGTQVGSQITGLTQAAISQARLGAMGIDAGTTAGHIFFDDVLVDDARPYGDRERLPLFNKWIFVDSTSSTRNEHIILGRGRACITLTGTGTNAVLTLYDTDKAGDAANLTQPLRVIRNLTANEFVGPIDGVEFTKGLYATLTGTNAQAWFDITSAPEYINLAVARAAAMRVV